jgi:hypothetical protein
MIDPRVLQCRRSIGLQSHELMVAQGGKMLCDLAAYHHVPLPLQRIGTYLFAGG